jgi:C1A family cysteine protease
MGHAFQNVLREQIGSQTAPVPTSTASRVNSKSTGTVSGGHVQTI